MLSLYSHFLHSHFYLLHSLPFARSYPTQHIPNTSILLHLLPYLYPPLLSAALHALA